MPSTSEPALALAQGLSLGHDRYGRDSEGLGLRRAKERETVSGHRFSEIASVSAATDPVAGSYSTQSLVRASVSRALGVLILAGTRKGLFLLRGDENRRNWQLEEPVLPGWSVYHATFDPRDGSLYVAANNFVYGATVQRSNDLGKTWERSESLGLPEESGLKLEAAWHVEPGHESQPDTLWLGGDPGVLFRTDDGGTTWEPVKGILEHPTREKWQPGAGGLCCHSIQLDPADPKRLYVGISAAGAFRTDDGGEIWTPINKNVAADFLPEPYPEVGQCVHKLLMHPAKPDRLWQQNPAASTARTTAATTASGSTGTACRATSASGSRSTHGTRTSPTPCPRRVRRTASRPGGGSASIARVTAARPGSCSRTGCLTRPGSQFCARGSRTTRSTRRASTSARRPARSTSRRPPARTG